MVKIISKINDYRISLTYSWGKILWLGLLSLILIINIFQLCQDISAKSRQRKISPYFFLGKKFSGLEDIFKDVKYAGYYSDKDMSIKQNAAQFAQAQYVLAPTILDLNNTHHDLVLFDCTSGMIALRKIKEIKAIPIKMNQFGIVFAQKIK